MEIHPGSGVDRATHWLRYERYPYLLTRLVLFVLLAAAAWAVLRALQDVLTPVLVSMLLAYLLDPFVDRFEERGFSRTIGIALCLAVGGVFVAAFLLFLWPTIAHLAKEITTGVPKLLDLLQNDTIPWIDRVVLPFVGSTTGLDVPGSVSEVMPEFWLGAVQDYAPGLLQQASNALGDVWGRTGALVASLLNLVLIPVLTFYFLRDFDKMRLAAVDYLPVHNRGWLLERIQKMDQIVGAWFRGQLEVAAILAVLYGLGLGIVFGAAGIGAVSGVAIGLLSGLLNIVPYFGFVVGIGFGLLMTLIDWTGWAPVLGVIAVFAVVQGLEGYVVTPRIVGEKVGLSPVVVIVALLVGASVLGLTGVLLALPIAGALGVLMPDLADWYRRSDLYTGTSPLSSEAEALIAAEAVAEAEAVALLQEQEQAQAQEPLPFPTAAPPSPLEPPEAP